MGVLNYLKKKIYIQENDEKNDNYAAQRVIKNGFC